uniref:Mannose-6-phosphate isomerase n=1 Tax=Heterorhabditis bacteriophora TaxID=37862 RepID=A0A1I7XRV3_HETBA
MSTNSIALSIMIIFSMYSTSITSELGAAFGDAAVSQILRHAASKVLAEPRIVEMLLKTKETPSLGPLAHLDILNRVAYKNLSVQFHPEAVHIVVDRFDRYLYLFIVFFTSPILVLQILYSYIF